MPDAARSLADSFVSGFKGQPGSGFAHGLGNVASVFNPYLSGQQMGAAAKQFQQHPSLRTLGSAIGAAGNVVPIGEVTSIKPEFMPATVEPQNIGTFRTKQGYTGRVTHALDPESNSVLIRALMSNEPVAYTNLAQRSGAGRPQYGVSMLSTSPKFRRQGIATDMMRIAEQYGYHPEHHNFLPEGAQWFANFEKQHPDPQRPPLSGYDRESIEAAAGRTRPKESGPFTYAPGRHNNEPYTPSDYYSSHSGVKISGEPESAQRIPVTQGPREMAPFPPGRHQPAPEGAWLWEPALPGQLSARDMETAGASTRALGGLGLGLGGAGVAGALAQRFLQAMPPPSGGDEKGWGHGRRHGRRHRR